MSNMPETTNMNRQFFIEWFPQIVYNHHQTGPAGAVIFMPPFRDPFNYNFDPLIPLGIELVGTAMHSRLVAEGKGGSAMRTGANYSTWWNGGLRTVTYFHNMIGILTEIIGSPTPIDIPLVPEKQLPIGDWPLPIAPTTGTQKWHYRQSIEYEMSNNRAILDLASRYRETFLYNIYRMGMNSIEKGNKDYWTVSPKRIAALDAAAAKEPARVIAIAEGHFDHAKIRAYAMRKGKLDQQQGHEVFLFPTGDKKTTSTLTFLDDRRIALVNGPSIAPLFDSHADTSAGDPARERAGRLDGAAAYMISRVPPIPDNAGSPGMQNAGSAPYIALARSVQWITLAARPEGENLRISLEGDCDNATDAQQLKSMLEVARMFGKAGLDSAKTKQSMDPAALAMVQTLLTNAEVTQAAERVRILLEITPDVWHLSGPKKPQI